MLVVFIRSLILYILVVAVMRFMGKRQIGELQPYEFSIALLISDLAAVPMANIGIPLLYGIVPILSLLLAQLVISLISLKSTKAREILCGKPSILIYKGTICEKTMRSLRYNLNDLLEQLRSKDFFDIAEVEYAILETAGKISVIPKAGKRPLTPEDMNLSPSQEDIPITLIMDGKVLKDNLGKATVSIEAVTQLILNAGWRSTSDILIASANTDGHVFLQGKEPDPRVLTTVIGG